ncbi:MAG: hypothetical protein PWQ08_608 [Clostridiales bacterium]|jgi:hypothetical protein|nr:hypothetical protein [Clostridiales bacterium]
MSKVFFAYQSVSKSDTSDNVDAIISAIKDINRSNTHQAQSWEDLRHNGRILVRAIFDAIDENDIFACDLSFLNHNVLFELGYAISKNKKLFILLNENIPNASTKYSKIDILRNIAYSKFENSNNIIEALDSLPENPKLLSDLSIANRNLPITHDIFYISNASNSQAQLDTYQFLRQSQYQVMFDDSSEVEYRPFAKYLESILCANNIVVHTTNAYMNASNEENAKASLLAGFGCGLQKNVLLLASNPYTAPIDYVDIMLKYDNAQDCIRKISDWASKYVQPLTSVAGSSDDTELDLLKLGLGYDVAENERDQLDNYFIETNAYKYAQKNNRAFFVGRKGTGKTAIYIMLNNTLSSDSNCYVISLKPESSELLDNVEVSTLYSSIAQKQSFFYSIWKFVIYSKLLIEIDLRLKNTQRCFEKDTIEQQIGAFVDKYTDILTKHFLELMKFMAENANGNVLQNIYIDYINPMESLLKKYFINTKYYKIAIIADNLDKTWDVKSNLTVQASMLLNLFEVTGHIENELKGKKDIRIETKVILFLRKDIFDYILKESREPDKLILNKQEIDWSNFPEQLKNLIEKRFAYVLELPQESNLSSVWSKYFALKAYPNTTVFNHIQEVCLPRPRDFLMFIRNLFESAVNSGHSKVLDADFEYALKEYSEFLYQNLIAEMTSEYPNIREILEHLHNHYISKIEFGKLKKELSAFLSEQEIDGLIDTLISNGYFKITNEKTGEVYKTCYYAQEVYARSLKKFLWFTIKPRKVEIYAALTPQYKRMGGK